jgi:hypothetical protein
MAQFLAQLALEDLAERVAGQFVPESIRSGNLNVAMPGQIRSVSVNLRPALRLAEVDARHPEGVIRFTTRASPVLRVVWIRACLAARDSGAPRAAGSATMAARASSRVRTTGT